MERVNVRMPSNTCIFNHHTAVIEEINPEFNIVLHQNAIPWETVSLLTRRMT